MLCLPDVGGGDPVLQDGAVLEVLCAGPAGERGEGDPGAGGLVEVVRHAERLLLVGARDVDLLLPLERPQAVGGVILRGWDVPDDTFANFNILIVSLSGELSTRQHLALCFVFIFNPNLGQAWGKQA